MRILTGAPFSFAETDVAVAQESERLAVNQAIRVRIPAVTPLRGAPARQARPQSSRSSADQSGRLRTGRPQVQLLPGAPFPHFQPFMLNAQDYFDKKLRRLDHERRSLQRRLLIRVPLDEPIQRGWRRSQVLSAKAERRADRDVLLTLLKIIGTTLFRPSSDFRKKRGRGRRRRYIEIEQPLEEINVGDWNWRRLPEEWKPYFRLEPRCHFRVWRDAFVFADASVFELKVEPHWVTETWQHDPLIQRRIEEIDAWLWARNAMPRLDWLCDNSRRAWSDSPRRALLDRIAHREMRAAKLAFPEVDLAASRRRGPISLWPSPFYPGVSPNRQRRSAQNGDRAGSNPVAETIFSRPRMQSVERPAFQAGPSGFESRRGCEFSMVTWSDRKSHGIGSADPSLRASHARREPSPAAIAPKPDGSCSRPEAPCPRPKGSHS